MVTITRPHIEKGFEFNRILRGESVDILNALPPHSVDLSFWSPPYFVGKSYEKNLDFDGWKNLVQQTISAHFRVIKPGSFLAVNIADILCFPDSEVPQWQADNINGKKCAVTKEDILAILADNPHYTRYQLAQALNCSEQTIQRRLENNNVRGGKASAQTKILLTSHLVELWGEQAGFFLYDKRIWHKDPCWANSRWHSNSYRAVDEFEYIYVLWKPGITQYNRKRLTQHEWSEWGSRGVWNIKSVSRNDRHEAEFPVELARRVIKVFSPANGTVIDPFVGSGTTAVAAKELGRRWLGSDISPECVALAQERLK